jgi:hypothetical protein
MKKLILVLVGLIFLFGVNVLVGMSGSSYPQYMQSLLARGLTRVEFQPGWDYEQIQTNDAHFLAHLADWLPRLREPNPNHSLKQGSFPLVLEFKDGSREELRFSGAPSPAYVLVYWKGPRVWGGEDPFTAFLRSPNGAALLKPKSK